jgi:hypothetical protein
MDEKSLDFCYFEEETNILTNQDRPFQVLDTFFIEEDKDEQKKTILDYAVTFCESKVKDFNARAQANSAESFPFTGVSIQKRMTERANKCKASRDPTTYTIGRNLLSAAQSANCLEILEAVVASFHKIGYKDLFQPSGKNWMLTSKERVRKTNSCFRALR